MPRDVRPRVFGSDAPFMAWIRSLGIFTDDREPVLPSSFFTNHDIDAIFHRYQFRDGRTTDVQCVLQMEIKEHDGTPRFSQRSLFWALHQYYDGRKIVRDLDNKKISLWHFGISCLVFPSRLPPLGEIPNINVRYGRFEMGQIYWRIIPLKYFIEVASFERTADDLRGIGIKRLIHTHHGQRAIDCIERTELGFVIPTRRVVKY